MDTYKIIGRQAGHCFYFITRSFVKRKKQTKVALHGLWKK